MARRHRRHERAPAGGEHEVDLDVAAVHAHVLDHPHVDDADAAVGAAGVVDVAQRVHQRAVGARRPHGAPPGSGSIDDAEAGGGRGARRVGGQRARGAHAPRRVEVGAAAHRAPAVRRPASATHSHTLPASCSAPARAAPSGCASTGTVQPQPASAQLQRSASKVSPHGHGRVVGPRAAASHSSAVGRRTAHPSRSAAQAQNACGIGEGHAGRGMVGQRFGVGGGGRCHGRWPPRRPASGRSRRGSGRGAAARTATARASPRLAHAGSRPAGSGTQSSRAGTRGMGPARWRGGGEGAREPGGPSASPSHPATASLSAPASSTSRSARS